MLSDHGQTQGATFLQRNGYGLDELVERNLRDAGVEHLAAGDENDTAVSKAVREATGRKQKDVDKHQVGDREGGGDRLGQPRAHLPDGRAATAHASRRSRSGTPTCSRRCARIRTSAGCWCAPPSTAPWRWAPAAPTT